MEQPSAVRVLAFFVPRQLGNNIEGWKNRSFLLNGGWLATQNVPTYVEWRVGRKIIAGGGDENGTHGYARRSVRLMLFLPHLPFRPAKNLIFNFSPSFHRGIVPLSGLIFGALDLLTQM